MAVPVLQTTGTLAAVTTGNLVITIPAHQTDDIVVLVSVGHVPNTTSGTSVMDIAGSFTKYTPDITTITGGIIDVEYALWWARSPATNGLGTSVTIIRPIGWDTGTDTSWGGIAYVIRGATNAGTPWDQITNTAISSAANPALPAVTVSGIERLVFVVMGKNDNTTTPTAATGYTAQTETPTTTGTDLAFRTYTRTAATSVTAVTPTGGVASANTSPGSVYFGMSFIPAPTVVSTTAVDSAGGFVHHYSPDTSTQSGALTTNNPHYGQGVKTDVSGTIDSIKAPLWKSGSPTGNVVAQIWSGGTGTFGTTQIPGTLLATSDAIDASTFPLSFTTDSTFTFSGANRINLTAGTEYYFVVYHATAQAATNFVRVPLNRGVPYLDPIGNGVYSLDNGVNFAAESPATDMILTVDIAGAVSLVTRSRTATGSGTGTETATGSRIGATFNRTATGSGAGTQTATGVRIAVRTALTDGGRGGGGAGFNPYLPSAASNSYGTSAEFKGMSFVGDGKKLASASFCLTRRNAGETGLLYARLYAHTGTYGSTGTGTSSPLAISNAVDITTIPTAASNGRVNVTFTFPDSDKYLLANGTNYVIGVYYGTQAVVNPLSIYGTQTLSYYAGNGSTFVVGWSTVALDYAFIVEGVSATGIRSALRTATGSGTGTASATRSIPKVGINWGTWGVDALIGG